MENSNLASIIIPTWNGMDFIDGCLKAVLAQTYLDTEIIVVDNASSDGTADYISQNFPKVHLVRNQQNLGFAAGVNVGLRQAKGEFLVLLNQDTVVDDNWLAELVNGMQADKTVGIGGCKIYDWSKQKLWHTGVILDEARRFPRLRGTGETDQGQYEKIEEMAAVVGAALALRRDLLQSIGFFDEDFYFYLEDTDYCLRAKEAGYKVMYYPKAVLRHYVAASLKKDSYEVFYRFHLSRLLFLLKHYGIDWFCHSFVPAEKEYLQDGISLSEFKALRNAYLHTTFQIAQNDSRYPIHPDVTTNNKCFQHDVLRALADLRGSTSALLYKPQNWRGTLNWSEEENWQIKRFEFRSSVPGIGSFLTGFRRWWSSIAAKWIERNLINQQNAINHRLIHLFEAQLETQSAFISILDAEVSFLSDQVINLKQHHPNTSDRQ